MGERGLMVVIWEKGIINLDMAAGGDGRLQ